MAFQKHPFNIIKEDINMKDIKLQQYKIKNGINSKNNSGYLN